MRIDLAGQQGRYAFASLGARTEPPPNLDKRVCACGNAVAAHVQPSLERANTMTPGTVKFYNDQKGYGFIAPADGSKDVFVHATALERAGMRSLVEGQKVMFDTQQDSRSGKIAVGNIQAA